MSHHGESCGERCMGCGSMHSMISLLLAAAMWWRGALFACIATTHMLSTVATTTALTPCLCALLRSASSRSGYLHIPLHGLGQKVVEPQPRVQGSGGHGTLRCRVTGAGPVLHGTRAGCGEHGGELCGGSHVGSHGGGMGLAGRPRWARSVPLGAGMRMGLGACCMRGVKGSQMRWVAGRRSEWVKGSGWLGR